MTPLLNGIGNSIKCDFLIHYIEFGHPTIGAFDERSHSGKCNRINKYLYR